MVAYVEDFLKLSIHDLKRMGMLRAGFTGSIVWKQADRVVSTVKLFAHLGSTPPQVVLQYRTNSSPESVSDWIQLQFQKSNLPNHTGGYWMFVCPVKKTPCRVLYLYQGHFVSRAALPPGTVYRCQATGRGYFQALDKMFNYSDKLEALEQALRKPYGKALYRGTPTKRVRRLDKKGSQFERVLLDLERLVDATRPF